MRIWSRLAHPAALTYEVGTSRKSKLKIGSSNSSSLIRLDSDVVHSIQYSHENQTLYVYFRVGRLYAYRDVPSEVYRELVRTGSRESFFEEKIRRSFACKRLSDTSVAESL